MPEPEPGSPVASEAAASKEIPRLVRRDLPFKQSRNVVQVAHNYGMRIVRLTRHDFFHVLLRFPTVNTTIALTGIWTLFILVFAAIYMAIDQHDTPGTSCGLGLEGAPVTFATAFGFSLQTATTVGYTLPNGVNGFFENCPANQTAIFFQTTFSMLFNAFLVAVMIGRLANSSNRAVQVVFSEKAIVSVVSGQVRFQVRVFDVDAKHPVVEAHVRLYAVRKDQPVPRPLRLIQPNDELGAKLILSLPQVVCHNIDLYSVLHPPRPNNPLRGIRSGLELRQADSVTCNREEVVCPVCSESYGTVDRWMRHVRFQQIAERQDEVPVPGSHQEIAQPETALNRYRPTENLQELQRHFQEEISEVVCVVEGIDPWTSGTFAGLQSYRLENIVWRRNAVFHPCITVESDVYTVDLDRFHDIIMTPGGRVQQMSMRMHDSFFDNSRK